MEHWCCVNNILYKAKLVKQLWGLVNNGAQFILFSSSQKLYLIQQFNKLSELKLHITHLICFQHDVPSHTEIKAIIIHPNIS